MIKCIPIPFFSHTPLLLCFYTDSTCRYGIVLSFIGFFSDHCDEVPDVCAFESSEGFDVTALLSSTALTYFLFRKIDNDSVVRAVPPVSHAPCLKCSEVSGLRCVIDFPPCMIVEHCCEIMSLAQSHCSLIQRTDTQNLTFASDVFSM